MPTLPSLRPNAPVTNVSITVVGAATGWEAIDDDPDSPNTSDYVYDAGATNGDLVIGLTDMPVDFSAMQSPLTVRAVTQAVGFTDDSDVLAVQLTDSAGTALSNSVTLSQRVQGGTQDTTQALRTASLTLNATGLAATKATWDDARLQMIWTYTANMSKDNGSIRVYALEIDGNYTATVNQSFVANLLTAPSAVATPGVIRVDPQFFGSNLLAAPATVLAPLAVPGVRTFVANLLAAPATVITPTNVLVAVNVTVVAPHIYV